MRISGRPLLDTQADAALFVDPQRSIEQLERAAQQGLNVLITGGRGAGKTSLLRQFLLRRRTSAAHRAAMVSAGRATNATEVIALVRHALVGDAEPSTDGIAAGLGGLDKALHDMADAAPDVLLLDNLPPTLAHALFGQLRDELWQLPLTWVVTCSDSDEAAFLRPPADAFFDNVLRLSPLDPGAMHDLLRRRVSAEELDDAAVQAVVELSLGNPRLALDLTRQLATAGTSPTALHADLARRTQVLAGLGRSAQMLLAELEASGGASASDEALLSRLGWTRSRAAQVLDQLTNAGLVEATDVRNGPGRPRRVYRPVSAFAR